MLTNYVLLTILGCPIKSFFTFYFIFYCLCLFYYYLYGQKCQLLYSHSMLILLISQNIGPRVKASSSSYHLSLFLATRRNSFPTVTTISTADVLFDLHVLLFPAGSTFCNCSCTPIIFVSRNMTSPFPFQSESLCQCVIYFLFTNCFNSNFRYFFMFLSLYLFYSSLCRHNLLFSFYSKYPSLAAGQ